MNILMSILATLLISLEYFAVGFVILQVITVGGWWILGLLAYIGWLFYITTIGGVIRNLGTGLILAVAYMFGGIFTSLLAFAVLLVGAEIARWIKEK